MAPRARNRKGHPPLRPQHDRDRSGAFHSRLSLLARDTEGSRGGSDLRDHAELVASCSSERDDDRELPVRELGGDRDEAAAGDRGGLRTDDDGAGGDRAGSQGDRLSPAKAAGRAEFPDVPDRYRREIEEALAETPGHGLRDGDGFLGLSEKLERNVSVALDRDYEILAIPPHLRPPDELAMWLRAILRASESSKRTLTKVDENRMRRQKLDVLPKLMEKIKEAKAKNPNLIGPLSRLP